MLKANPFFGRCYLYGTPEGAKPIGVTQGLGDTWIVAYFAKTGARRRIKSPFLDPNQDPERLQKDLDGWAYSKHLIAVRVDLRPCPLCGTTLVEIHRHPNYQFREARHAPTWIARCNQCHLTTDWNGTEAEAVDAWEAGEVPDGCA